MVSMKVTLDIRDDLYRAIKIEAARRDRTVRDIADEALEAWLEVIEDAEDVAAATEAEAEYQRDGGGIEIEEYFRTRAAEDRAKYGTDAG